MEFDLRKIQLLQLDMFKAVKDICDKYQIKYFAIGGTLLGAVRHQGFIPWDDDIDIGMTRKEYEKFLTHVDELPDPYEFRYVEIGHKGNIINKNIGISIPPNMIDNSNGKYNLFMDIMIIEGCSNTLFGAHLHMFHFLYLRMLYKLTFIDVLSENNMRSNFENKIIRFARITKINNLLNRNKINNKLQKCMKKYDANKTKYASILFGRYRFRDIYPSDIWKETVQLNFEDIEISAPKKYQEYLSSIYGENYMEPPKDKDIYTHSIEIDYIKK